MTFSRRDVLRAGSMAALGGLSLGCPLQRPPQTAAMAPVPETPPGGRAPWSPDGTNGLARVDVAASREIRTVVGLRPVRALRPFRHAAPLTLSFQIRAWLATARERPMVHGAARSATPGDSFP